jgi:protein-L-isoaspartate(D-aspartate) O-methyltransferase
MTCLQIRSSLLILGVLLMGCVLELRAQEKDSYQKLRLKMVEEQIEREGIKNEAVLRAMRTVPRHRFVADKLRANAYYDQILPIGYKQTLSPGYIVAYETEMIDPQPTDRVLEIGTGSGYQASVLAQIVKEVYTIEIVEPLGKEAAARIKDLGYKNIFTKIGDGYKGWPEKAPFDKILVTCSPEKVPQPLVDELREGGKMIIPLGERYNQAFYLFEKQDGKLVQTKLLPTLFVPMTGIAEDKRQLRADGANPHLANGSFELETNGIPDSWYYQRQATLEQKGAKKGKNYLTFSNKDPGRDAQALQGFGVDGTHVKSLRVSLWAKAEDAFLGPQRQGPPALVLHFFDTDNKMLSEHVLRLGQGTFDWKQFSERFPVPPKTQMAVIRIGLNGTVGSLSIDDVQVSKAR